MAEITPTFALASTNVVNLTDFNSFRPAKYIVSLSGSVDFLQVFLDGIEHKFPTDVKNFVLDCRNYKKCMVYSEGTGAVTFTEVGEATNPFFNTQCYSGTWAPAISLANPGDSAFTYTANNGIYTIVGNLIWFDLFIDLATVSIGTGSGNILISLPFASNLGAVSYALFPVAYKYLDTPVSQNVIARNTSGESSLIISSFGDNSALNTFDAVDTVLSANTDIMITGTYRKA